MRVKTLWLSLWQLEVRASCRILKFVGCCVHLISCWARDLGARLLKKFTWHLFLTRLTQKPLVGIKPATFLLWDNGASHRTTVPSSLQPPLSYTNTNRKTKASSLKICEDQTKIVPTTQNVLTMLVKSRKLVLTKVPLAAHKHTLAHTRQTQPGLICHCQHCPPWIQYVQQRRDFVQTDNLALDNKQRVECRCSSVLRLNSARHFRRKAQPAWAKEQRSNLCFTFTRWVVSWQDVLWFAHKS